MFTRTAVALVAPRYDDITGLSIGGKLRIKILQRMRSDLVRSPSLMEMRARPHAGDGRVAESAVDERIAIPRVVVRMPEGAKYDVQLDGAVLEIDDVAVEMSMSLLRRPLSRPRHRPVRWRT